MQNRSCFTLVNNAFSSQLFIKWGLTLCWVGHITTLSVTKRHSVHDRMVNKSVAIGGMRTDRGKGIISFHFVLHKSHTMWCRTEPGSPAEKPMIKSLSYGMAWNIKYGENCRKQSRPILIFCISICLGGTEENNETSVRTTGLRADQTQYL